VPYTHPTFAETSKAALKGTMFYELHPQLWGKGIMSEAFTEVLRFAMEEVGVDVMVVSNRLRHRPSGGSSSRFFPHG
jgi:RimJ/RimL family protein N-acetyltransferase